MKIFCIGRNYADHAAEMGSNVPKQPMVFMKPPTALLINDKPFYYPDFSNEIHYEAEIVLRICKNGKHVKPEFAHTYYDAIGLGIDFTARDLQRKCKEKGHPWEIAKGFDNSAPISKFWPLDDFEDLTSIQFSLQKNEVVVQKGDTAHLIFDYSDLICHISKFFKIQHGDLIFTGTPAGVGPVLKGDKLVGKIGDREVLHCEIR
ncbi:MAG: 2-hydroxyhepta-2,4-diene-1,7-dioate isomerase [Bacteroidetes bacterium]|nr:MAG: 2-hydroxyhepta-2,4-diene-1,7-dioate isomerase [Bacteroidota bacterium]